MSRKYTREDVQTHRLGYGYGRAPAVNVKSYSFIPTHLVTDKFGCSEKQAETALRYAWESACETFWDMDAPEIVVDVFGKYVKSWSEGRSGGWLVVEGLPPVDEWDAIMLGKWRSFETRIRKDIEYLTSAEYALDMIEANGWAEPEERDQNEVVARYERSLAEPKS